MPAVKTKPYTIVYEDVNFNCEMHGCKGQMIYIGYDGKYEDDKYHRCNKCGSSMVVKNICYPLTTKRKKFL